MRAEYTINHGKIRHMTKYKTLRGYLNRFYLYDELTSFAVFDDNNTCIAFGAVKELPDVSFMPKEREYYTIRRESFGLMFDRYYPANAR